ncbi:uncharacterized protein AB675_677 [Cyphellophora attinorum]|uniref:Uncharacterized protein n=1 Tax=Cyphellophora attinorum TaxID=1664694 RepID=A0A0N1I1Z8_9EURO|nr:uncharacterized protein AB675_677 [Phialophora attinorum]KPI46087.1 hypothetical protein AB675_677 [Phialophora attinorum]
MASTKSSTTALILCGKIPGHIEPMINLLRSDGYDVIHNVRTLPSALLELPALLRTTVGCETQPPSSGFGSNATAASAEDRTPGSEVKAVVVGGGYSPEEFEEIKGACDGVKELPFFRADVTKKRSDGQEAQGGAAGPPPVEELKGRLVQALKAADTAAGEGGGWQPGVYLF